MDSTLLFIKIILEDKPYPDDLINICTDGTPLALIFKSVVWYQYKYLIDSDKSNKLQFLIFEIEVLLELYDEYLELLDELINEHNQNDESNEYDQNENKQKLVDINRLSEEIQNLRVEVTERVAIRWKDMGLISNEYLMIYGGVPEKTYFLDQNQNGKYQIYSIDTDILIKSLLTDSINPVTDKAYSELSRYSLMKKYIQN